MENDKIVSLINLFQHLLSAEIYLTEKLNLYFTYLVRNFQINARNRITAKCLLTSSIIQGLILGTVVKSM